MAPLAPPVPTPMIYWVDHGWLELFFLILEGANLSKLAGYVYEASIIY